MESADQLAHFIKEIKDPDESYVVLVAGASGSGKTTEARKVAQLLDRMGVPLVRMGNRPYVIEADMFYREDVKELSELLGSNYDHPLEIDVGLLEEVINALMEGEETKIPFYDFKSGKREGYKGVAVPDKNPVIIVEGIYAIGLLSHRSNLNVYVEARSRMELFARRLLRDVERIGNEMERIAEITLTAMAMWNIYGETQRKYADIVLRSNYSIIEDKGSPSYQIKVPDDVFSEKMPSTYGNLVEAPPIRVEDLLIGDIDERMRGRLLLDGYIPRNFELSYRALYPDDMPFTKSLKVVLPPQMYTTFVKTAQIMGYSPRIIYREIRALEKDGALFKWYPEKGLVEVETREEKKIMSFVRRFRGNIRLLSYYGVID